MMYLFEISIEKVVLWHNVGRIKVSTADNSASNYKMPVQMLIRRLHAICRL